MENKPGELYFMYEKDWLTEKRTNYIKIGIVRNTRSASDRAGDHQTGNPRLVENLAVIQTQAINKLETTLHQRLAPYRITGEWFDLTETQIANAIDTAKQLASEVDSAQRTFIQCEQLGTQISTDLIMPATTEANDIFDTLKNYKLELDAVKLKLKAAKSGIQQAAMKSGGVRGICKWSPTAPSTRFDKTKLQKTDPQLWEKYCTKHKLQTKFLISFDRVSRSSSIEPNTDLDLEDTYPTDAELKIELARQPVIEMLHASYLQLLTEQAHIEWKNEFLEAELKVLCGETQGIENICTWKRENKIDFDLETFKKENPDLATSFMVSSGGRPRFGVYDYRQYPR